jgi:hypothetical protein
MGITVSGDDPTGIPGTVTPEPPPTVTVSIPGTPIPVTIRETVTASATPSVTERTVTATPSASAAPVKTPSPKDTKPKVIYRTKTAQPSTAPNPVPAATPGLSSTVRPEGEILFPSVAGSPVQSQPGIVIQMPSTQPVANDVPGAMTWVLVGLLVVVVLGVMSVGLWAFVRKVKRAG